MYSAFWGCSNSCGRFLQLKLGNWGLGPMVFWRSKPAKYSFLAWPKSGTTRFSLNVMPLSRVLHCLRAFLTSERGCFRASLLHWE